MEHSYSNCQAKTEIDNLKIWQTSQNGHLRSIDRNVGELATAEAKRSGAEGMLKWLIGVVGFSGVAALASLIANIVR
jgi:hypothetical protein